MKTILSTLFIFCFCISYSPAQDNAVLKYDSLSVESLDADAYGMKKYVMAFLKKGPNRNQPEKEAAELQNAHMANIRRMAEEGDLVLAGPFIDGGDIQGIYVFNVETIEEARKLTETDPAIKAGRLVMELHPWYGTAALMKINEIHGIIKKKDF
ncbi:YciI family protein [Marinigracilibium pacificum]|uniref:YCII-related domain-containing protein n=1 Tax=Marinigracilibium pacificum TaxID=2729599 RepID=A0A848IYD5_9BACT|nr:YciI family protein [Marinigracilibium pacificum]NMM48646.1 hypothetical protein [Marinigracilibium pacificum]